MLVKHRGKENEIIRSFRYARRELDYPRQHSRCLYDGALRITAKRIAARQLNRKIQTLVEYARKRMSRVQTDRREHRHHLAKKIILDPPLLLCGPLRATQEADALRCQCRENIVVQQHILMRHQTMRLLCHQPEGLFRRFPIRSAVAGPKFNLLFQSGHPNLEKLIKVGGHDGQEPETFQRWNVAVFCLREDAPVEGQQLNLAVQKQFSRFSLPRRIRHRQQILWYGFPFG